MPKDSFKAEDYVREWKLLRTIHGTTSPHFERNDKGVGDWFLSVHLIKSREY